LHEHLAVAQARLSMLLVGEFIVLPQSETADRACQVNGSERPGVELVGFGLATSGPVIDGVVMAVGAAGCSPEGG